MLSIKFVLDHYTRKFDRSYKRERSYLTETANKFGDTTLFTSWQESYGGSHNTGANYDISFKSNATGSVHEPLVYQDS